VQCIFVGSDRQDHASRSDRPDQNPPPVDYHLTCDSEILTWTR
jgi:hypothetical protein